MKMSLFELINENKNKGYEPDGLTDHDLGVLADWASEWKNCVVNPDWKRAYALIREGADLLLRRRARSSMPANISPPETLPEPFEPQMQAIKG
jgi:hypothetical protein